MTFLSHDSIFPGIIAACPAYTFICVPVSFTGVMVPRQDHHSRYHVRRYALQRYDMFYAMVDHAILLHAMCVLLPEIASHQHMHSESRAWHVSVPVFATPHDFLEHFFQGSGHQGYLKTVSSCVLLRQGRTCFARRFGRSLAFDFLFESVLTWPYSGPWRSAPAKPFPRSLRSSMTWTMWSSSRRCSRTRKRCLSFPHVVLTFRSTLRSCLSFLSFVRASASDFCQEVQSILPQEIPPFNGPPRLGWYISDGAPAPLCQQWQKIVQHTAPGTVQR